MRSGAWSLRTAGKYILLQLPGYLVLIALLLLAGYLGDFPRWVLWLVLAGWALKDLLLYPLVWRSYSAESPPPPMVGLSGVARERIDRQGYVTVRGELWRAELAPGADPIDAGEKMVVCGQRGLTLIVTARDDEPYPPRPR